MTIASGKCHLDLRREAPEAYRALAALTRAGALDHRLLELVKVRASQLNGCAHCAERHLEVARRAGEAEARLDALPRWRESAAFTGRERSALALTDALTLVARAPLPEEALAEAARHFDRHELADLVVAITAINAWNRVTLAGRLPLPGLGESSTQAPGRAAA